MGIFGSNPLGPGEKAPDLAAKNQDGAEIRLLDFAGKSNIVLFFYPRDNTPVCTQEACLFRDSYDGIQAADAVVLGISNDPESSHADFRARHQMPFDLLTDPNGEWRKAFRVSTTLGVIPGRVTFVIDKEGTIRHVTNNQLSAQRHVDEALEALRNLH
ncbi:MAG: peroxiredoxin [Myxococcota bacterium]